MKTQVLAQNEQQSSSPIKSKQQVQAPKPKFEFYTLLGSNQSTATVQTSPGTDAVVRSSGTTSDNTIKSIATVKPTMPPVSSPAPTMIARVKPAPAAIPATVAPALPAKESYLVQVAAFKARQDAEKMKASLILKGFNVNIATVTQQHGNWYRVIIGPFSTRALAEKAQIIVSQSEHTKGMIRKMDA